MMALLSDSTDGGGDALAWYFQGCPIPGNIQCQVGWGSEQPALVEDVPAHCNRVGLDDL